MAKMSVRRRGLKWSFGRVCYRAVVGTACGLGLAAAANAILVVLLQPQTQVLLRFPQETRVLAMSRSRPSDGQHRNFAKLYGESLGARPTTGAVRDFFDAQLHDRDMIVLDEVMANYLVQAFGRIDGRTVPAGIYLGARSIGPQSANLVQPTKYLAHWLIFSRHSYLLVVPDVQDDGKPCAYTFSAAQEVKFQPDAPDPNQLVARMFVYGPDNFDFPGPGQAIHELFRITDDPVAIKRAIRGLPAAADAFKAAGISYSLLNVNSNTVIGCLLRSAVPSSTSGWRSMLLRFRAPGLATIPRTRHGLKLLDPARPWSEWRT